MANSPNGVVAFVELCREKWVIAEESGSTEMVELDDEEIALFESAGFCISQRTLLLLYEDSEKGALDGTHVLCMFVSCDC